MLLSFGLCLAGALLSKFSSGLLFFAFGAFALSTRFLALPETPQGKPELRAWRRARWQWTPKARSWRRSWLYCFYFLFSLNQSTDALSLIGHSAAWVPLRRLLMPPWLYLRGLLFFAISSSRPTFILGHGYPHGVWFYFPVMLVLRSPLGFLGLLALALALALEQKRHPRRLSAIAKAEAWRWRVLWVSLAVFMAACMLARLSISIRHFSVPTHSLDRDAGAPATNDPRAFIATLPPGLAAPRRWRRFWLPVPCSRLRASIRIIFHSSTR